LYVSNWVSPGAVTVIDLANGGATQTITGLVSYPGGLALSPDGKQLWVAAAGASWLSQLPAIEVIDTTTNQLVTSITMPAPGVSAVTFTPDGLKVYATYATGGNLVSVIDTTRQKVTTTIAVGRALGGLGEIAIQGQTAYVLARHRIGVIDTTSDQLIKTIKLGTIILGHHPAFFPGRPYLYVPEATPSAVALLATSNNTLVGGGFSCSSGAYDVAIAPNGARVYVVDEFANKVTIATIH
jgi:YVTN family beta-propeller protein